MMTSHFCIPVSCLSSHDSPRASIAALIAKITNSMTKKISWYNHQKTILRHTFNERMDGPTFAQSIQTVRRMTLHLDHPVDILSDLRGCHLAPFSMFRAGHIAENLIPENIRYSVIVLDEQGTVPRFVKTMVSLGRQLGSRLAKNTFLVNSVEEGLCILDDIDRH